MRDHADHPPTRRHQLVPRSRNESNRCCPSGRCARRKPVRADAVSCTRVHQHADPLGHILCHSSQHWRQQCKDEELLVVTAGLLAHKCIQWLAACWCAAAATCLLSALLLQSCHLLAAPAVLRSVAPFATGSAVFVVGVVLVVAAQTCPCPSCRPCLWTCPCRPCLFPAVVAAVAARHPAASAWTARDLTP
eukprot:5373704-Amphidinium_carterae.1